MGEVEALTALEQFSELHETDSYRNLKANFQAHAGNISALQDKNDGRWHNILDEDSTFLETSSTGMFLTAFIRGVTYGWLDKDQYISVIHQGCEGLAKTVDIDGTIGDIIGETGIKDYQENYAPDNTNYENSSPGIGAVLRALAALSQHREELLIDS